MIAEPTETCSSTMSGSTRNVTNDHAIPMSPMTIRPRKPARSSIALMISETVAVTIAHGRITPARARAAASAEPRVGSRPSRRSFAAHTNAVLKKIVT